MTLASDVESMYKHTKDVYDAISALGGTLPTNKNLDNLVTAFDSLPVIIEPEIPNLSQTLTSDDFDKIKKIIDDGKASEYFNLGDEFKVQYGEYVMPFEVVGFNNVELQDGSKVPAINLLSKYRLINTAAWGGGTTKYSSSGLRSGVNSVFLKALDNDFTDCLANSKVQTFSRDGSTDIVYDKLFVPSMAQLGVANIEYNTSNQNSIEGPAFASYQNADDSKRIKYGIRSTNSAEIYWTRSLYWYLANDFGHISKTGAPGHTQIATSQSLIAACNFVGTVGGAVTRA